MRLILTENVPSLGDAGEIVSVRGGYARNFLLPRKKALLADSRNIKALEHAKFLAEHKLRKLRSEAEQLADRLKTAAITITHKAGESGKLFGAVTTMEIEKALHAEGIAVDRKSIQLDSPIKELGEYTIPVKLDLDVVSELIVQVVKEQ